MVSTGKRRDLLLMILFFLLYVFTARFGIFVSAIHDFAALVWPPTAIALAGLIIFGNKLWPAVFLGAFVVNTLIGANTWSAIGIATGNTLEAVVGAAICSSRFGFRPTLERLKDVIRLIATSLLCTLISSSLGIWSLWISGTLESSNIREAWIYWWAGDALAAMAITPLLLAFLVSFRNPNQIQLLTWNRSGVLEKIVFASLLVGLTTLVFQDSPLIVLLIGFKGVYILLPVLLWGAMRFGQVGAAVVTFTIFLIAVWSTAHDYGPFVENERITNLFHLLIFVGTMSATGMFVGSVLAERELEKQHLIQNDLELSAAKEAAEAANMAKSTFLANMSHEIRTPLGAVMGFSELVSEKGVDAEQRASYLSAIHRNGELLTILINDILDLSKIEAGKMEMNFSEHATMEIVNDVQMTLEKHALKKGIELRIHVDENVPKVICTDAVRLRQILINVLGNAIKFTSKGYTSLNISSSHRGDGHENLSFVIKDTGVGIRREDFGLLFSPFSQIDASSKRRYGGTGLGLVLSKKLAKLLGGDVFLSETVRNEGSTFVVTIDGGIVKNLSPHIKQTPVPLVETSPSELKGIHVLLAEDSKDNQLLVSHMLHRAGAVVDVVDNGQDAITRAQEKRFDVILMDLQMPIMDGYEATAKLRRSGYSGKIVALTAHALDSEIQYCLANGFDEHISKPIRRGQLMQSLGRSSSSENHA